MTVRSTTDVIIIGAGVVGCSIALGLTRRGLRTLNVDALPAAGYGSTSQSSAIVRPFYSHVTAAALAHESRFRWLEWADFLGVSDERGMAGYTECGGLVLVKEGSEQDYDQNLKVLDEVGVEYELMDSVAVTAMYPGICLDSFAPVKRVTDEDFGRPGQGRIGGGIFIPAAGYVSDPQLAAHNLQAAALAGGGSFVFRVRVSAILQDGGKVSGVRLDDGREVGAPVVVNAAGPHSFVINDLAGINTSMKISTLPHRHEVAYLRAPSSLRVAGGGFLVDLDTGVYQRPDGEDILIGSADPDCDPPEVVDPDDYNAELTEQWTQQVYRSAQRFPELGIESKARGTVGVYDVSDDWIPLYDKTDLQGFYLAIGTSGNQFKNAPVVGDLMAEIIVSSQKGVDHDVSPARLRLPHLERTVDLSFYSRNRIVQATRSVMA